MKEELSERARSDQPTANALMRVDSHAHVVAQHAPLTAERHSEPRHDATVSEYLATLDSLSISHAVLTQPSFYGTDNSLLLCALAAHPDRLRGTVIVNPAIDEVELDALRAGGVCGVRLNWSRLPHLPDIHGYGPLLGRLRDVGLHIELYVEGAKLAALLPFICDSGVSIVLDHFGSPDPREGVAGASFRAVLRALERGRCWVKLSAPYRLGNGVSPVPYATTLLAAGGAERLVWGSDWPWVSHEAGRNYAQLLEALDEWVPDDRSKRAILSTTPASLFGF